jgi:lipoprotein signal peptidase
MFKESRLTLNESGNDNGRIRLLWVGLVTYFLIFMNSARYLTRFPYQVLIAGALINAGMITAFVVALRKAYRNRRPPNSA